MVSILYTTEREFMRKTFESVDRCIDADSAYLALRPEARGSCSGISEVEVDSVTNIDERVRELNPDVVVRNHRYLSPELTFDEEFPVVHIRHGASVGRGEIGRTAEWTGDIVDTALAPGERWAEEYRNAWPANVDVEIVGIPEADKLVGTSAPRERRVLYAPTNHNYGAGSYTNTAEHVLGTFADSKYELLFRPHPHDRTEEPGKSVTKRCKARIAELPNVTFDERPTPRRSMLDSDLLISDYSGIVTEWLHTGRPLVQLTDIASETNDVPAIGHTTDALDLELVDDLYDRGYPSETERRLAEVLDDLGIPMDGRASDRAANAITKYVA